MQSSSQQRLARAFRPGGSRLALPAALLLGALLISIAAACGDSAAPEPGVTTVRVGDATFQTEVAWTTKQRVRGLSKRDALPVDEAMLFVFKNPQNGTLVMNEMRFPLDFIWVSADRRVVNLHQDVPVPVDPEAPLIRYRAGVDVQYVLEVNAGQVEELGIAIGDEVTFDPEVDPALAQ